MGSPKGGSAPQAPNPQMMVNQQSNSNIQTAAANSYLNAINQYTPYGNTIWKQVGTRKMGDGTVEIPEWQVYQDLSPEQDKLYKTQTAISQGALNLGQDYINRIKASSATPFDYSGMPAAPTVDLPKYDANYRQHVYDTILQRNSPQMQRDEDALRQRLADQGIGIQDPAYRTAYDQYQRGINDFRLGADIQSGQEARGDYSTALTGAQARFNMQGSARDRAIQEELTRRNQPINELTALLGLGGGGVRQPTYVNTQQVPIAPTDTYTPQQMAYQGQLANWQAQQQSQNAMLGGLFSLGSAGLMAGMMPGGLFGLGRAGANGPYMYNGMAMK